MQSCWPAPHRDHTLERKIVGLRRPAGLQTVKLGVNESCGHSLSPHTEQIQEAPGPQQWPAMGFSKHGEPSSSRGPRPVLPGVSLSAWACPGVRLTAMADGTQAADLISQEIQT